MGNSSSQTKEMPPRPPVAAGKTRICIAGFGISHHTNRAGKIARVIVETFPAEFETWFFFNSKLYRDGMEGGNGVLGIIKKELTPEQQTQFAAHRSSPFVWLEMPGGEKKALGGRDKFAEWAKERFAGNEAILKVIVGPSLMEAVVNCSQGTAPAQ
eukprot:gene22395-29506_t